jgi:threonine/homoserine/homoserine lactone efflux protein
MEGLIGFVMAGFALVGSPGPATMSLAAMGAAFGARRSLGYMAGIIGGMVVVIGVTASGVTSITSALPGATPLLTALAAAYIGYLAYRIATAPALAEQGSQLRQPSFTAGFLLSLVNPKGYVAMAALFTGFVLVHDRVGLDVALKVAILVAMMSAVDTAWLFAGAALTQYFRDPGINRVINLAFAVLLIVSVAMTLLF